MSKYRNIFIFTFLAALVAVLAYFFFNLMESYAEETDLGWQKEAQLNPFLAAELYAKQLGLDATSYDSLEKVNDLSDIDTLFISNSSQVLSEGRMFDLLDWLNNGGHLIIAAQGPSSLNTDRILEYFSITALSSDYIDTSFNEIFLSTDNSNELDDEADDEESTESQNVSFREAIKLLNEELAKTTDTTLSHEQRIANYENGIPDRELTLMEGVNNNSLQVRFDPAIILSHPFLEDRGLPEGELPQDDLLQGNQFQPSVWQGSSYGIHFLQFTEGDGLLTVISNASIFASNNIDKFDHAYLWETLNSNGQILAILYGSNMPSLGQILIEYALEIMLVFSLFVTAWIWQKTLQFGPVLKTERITRRSISEHIHASAHFLWRGGWQDTLLKPLRDNITRKAAAVAPGYSSSSPALQFKKLSQLSGIDEERVFSVMQTTGKLSEDSFMHNVQILQQIRKSL